MNRVTPPSWLECLLLFLLPTRDRETVCGDLYEEYSDKLLKFGTTRASLWYMRQVFSFAPRKFGSSFVQEPALRFLCVFTAIAGLWLGMMELQLRHLGFAGRESIAVAIVSQALLTLAWLHFRRNSLLRWSAGVGSVSLFLFAAKALATTLKDMSC